MLGNHAAIASVGGENDSALIVGSARIDNRVFLAPMSGVTDVAFRRIARRAGAGLVVSEMVASDMLALGNAEACLRAEAPGIGPHVVQLAGCDPTSMGKAARIAEGSGADLIDINMGCPAKRVTGGWAGSALMRDLDHALTLIEAAVAAVSVPVTVKMRLGWDETTLNAPDLARRAEAAGVAMITVHGRTRSQFYNGKADWRAIRAIREAISIPLVANGDCRSLSDALAMLAASGADAVMVGRAAQGRSWLAGAIAEGLATGVEPPPPAAAVQRDMALEHYDGLLVLYGRSAGVRHARKHLASTMDAVSESHGAGSASLRAQILTSDDPAAVAADFARFCEASDGVSGEREAA